MDSSSTISPRLSCYKLNASFKGKTVTHLTIKANLEAKQRRIEVQTVWQTEDRLGSGAFGVVWRQRADSGLVRAVKVISREQLNIQEVEALIDLQDHPDLFIRFFGWFEDLDRDAIHLAMEYIEHGHLGTYITQYQTKVNTKEITAQILEGLVVLHEREICHRDLKPQNILVASLSPIWVKISDFGISKRWVGTSLKTHCGTAIYRAPEQLGILPREFRAAGNSYTNNIDIWALGAIVHEMLTLEIPFLDTYSGDSGFTSGVSIVEATLDTSLLYGYCHGAQPFPCSKLRSQGVAEDGIEFVKNLMAVNPSERLSAAGALTSEWLAQKESPHRPVSPEPVIPTLAAATGLPEPSPIMEAEDVYIPPFRELFHTAKETDKAVVHSPQYSEPPPPARAEQWTIEKGDPPSLSATSQTSTPTKTSRMGSIRDRDLPSNIRYRDQAVRTVQQRRRSPDEKEEDSDSSGTALPMRRALPPPPGRYEQPTLRYRVAPVPKLQLPNQQHGSSSKVYDDLIIDLDDTHRPTVLPQTPPERNLLREWGGSQPRIQRLAEQQKHSLDDLASKAAERAAFTLDFQPLDVATSTQRASSASGSLIQAYDTSQQREPVTYLPHVRSGSHAGAMHPANITTRQRGSYGEMKSAGPLHDHRAPDTIRQWGKDGDMILVPEPGTYSHGEVMAIRRAILKKQRGPPPPPTRWEEFKDGLRKTFKG